MHRVRYRLAWSNHWHISGVFNGLTPTSAFIEGVPKPINTAVTRQIKPPSSKTLEVFFKSDH
jgi:hypothetical protein